MGAQGAQGAQGATSEDLSQRPWFGIDFLTWQPPPKPVSYCQCCGLLDDDWMSMYAVQVFVGGERRIWPFTVCENCQPLPDLSARAEVYFSIVLGRCR
jgi:hypothetical protein